jgi:hypothetical protein
MRRARKVIIYNKKSELGNIYCALDSARLARKGRFCKGGEIRCAAVPGPLKHKRLPRSSFQKQLVK